MTSGTTDHPTSVTAAYESRCKMKDCPKGGVRCRDFEVLHDATNEAAVAIMAEQAKTRNVRDEMLALADAAGDGLVRVESIYKVLDHVTPETSRV